MTSTLALRAALFACALTTVACGGPAGTPDAARDVVAHDGVADDAPDAPAPLDAPQDLDAGGDDSGTGDDTGVFTDAPVSTDAGPSAMQTLGDPCAMLTPTIRGTTGPDMLHGTPGDDVIFGGDGDDVIDGGGGNDVICGGNGQDTLIGGAGDDYLDGGGDIDSLYGDDGPGASTGASGRDVLHGRGGSDLLHGGPGNDLLFGDILDDDLYGDDGNDVLVGGHGNDFMHGGTGDDYLRGDTGRDTFVGGTGQDTASFETALPPGQALAAGQPVVEGVTVDLTARLAANEGGYQDLLDHGIDAASAHTAGVASGDGFREAVLGVERVVGSAFDDRLVGDGNTVALAGGYGDDALSGGAAGAMLDGGPGHDQCNGTACDAPGEPAPRPDGPMVARSAQPADLGVFVIGSRGGADDAFEVALTPGGVRVTGTPGVALTAGTGCVNPDPASPHVALCPLPGPMYFLAGYGGDGNDRFVVDPGLPRDATTHIAGGDGDDELRGGDGPDVLFSGPSGRDTLVGNAGDDALLSETADNTLPSMGTVCNGGSDTLDGGDGDDQLVADYPCGGHQFTGGAGTDIAGFRRSTGTSPPFAAIHAQLGGTANNARPFLGRAFAPSLCAMDPCGTHVAGDLEILEGADGDDQLVGNDHANTIWGWGGDDVIDGDDGNDELYGHLGNDSITGGAGRDAMYGNAGNNTLYARDGTADRVVDCGGGTLASSDPSDAPAVNACH